VAGIEEMKKADIHHGEKKDYISSCSLKLHVHVSWTQKGTVSQFYISLNPPSTKRM
jgi:hypothetical protein